MKKVAEVVLITLKGDERNYPIVVDEKHAANITKGDVIEVIKYTKRFRNFKLKQVTML